MHCLPDDVASMHANMDCHNLIQSARRKRMDHLVGMVTKVCILDNEEAVVMRHINLNPYPLFLYTQ